VEHYTLTCKSTSLWRSSWILARIGQLDMKESCYGIFDDSSLTPVFITGQQQFDYPRSHLNLTSTTCQMNGIYQTSTLKDSLHIIFLEDTKWYIVVMTFSHTNTKPVSDMMSQAVSRAMSRVLSPTAYPCRAYLFWYYIS
jgi:hypothetical protein